MIYMEMLDLSYSKIQKNSDETIFFGIQRYRVIKLTRFS
jgi:hypothetical protein